MGTHIIELFLTNTGRFGQKEVLRYKEADGLYRSLLWKDLKKQVDNILSCMHILGVKRGDMVGIFSQNKWQWIATDLAIMALGAVVVPLYATSSREQLAYISRETDMKLIFTGDDQQTALCLEIIKEGSTLQKVISFGETAIDDKKVLGFQQFLRLSFEHDLYVQIEERMGEYSSDDLATVIYTSGTTGEPKGVMLRQENFLHCFSIHDHRLDISTKDVSMCFLPLSHVFERMWSHYLLYKGAVNVLLENPREIIEVLPVVKPTVMCAVPRFFDKTYAGIQAETLKWSSTKRNIFNWSVNQGLKSIEYTSKGQKLPFAHRIKHGMANRMVLKKLRAIFGGNFRVIPCAGAAINPDILKFFHAIGLFVNYGYGATETTATVSCYKSDKYNLDTCGTIIPGIEVKISDKNEILVKGKTVFHGYYKKEKETAEVLKDGWFYTGDEGYIDDYHNLIMVDRIKDLMKTSVGKYVSPQKLEMLLSKDDLVEQLIVVGDNRKYVSALIVPAMDKLTQLAKENKIEYTSDQELVKSPAIVELLSSRFEKLQQDLMPHERVARFALLAEPFSIENGTMTNTLKVRRSFIEKRYKDIVEKLYA